MWYMVWFKYVFYVYMDLFKTLHNLTKKTNYYSFKKIPNTNDRSSTYNARTYESLQIFFFQLNTLIII